MPKTDGTGKRHLNTAERRARVSESLRLYVDQVGRKAPKNGEPNDRRCSRDTALRAKRMKPEMLDLLLRDDG